MLTRATSYGEVSDLKHVEQWKSLLIGFPEILDPIYIDRTNEEEHLFKLINEFNHVLITGSEGIGKSALAIHCALKWIKRNYISYTAFLFMESEETAQHSLKSLAKKIGFFIDKFSDETIQKLFTYIKTELKSKKLLLIYDNIENVDIKKYLPNETNIIVLGTTVYKKYKKLFHVHKLKKLLDEQSIRLMLEVIKDFKIEVSEAKKVIRCLNNSPLAIKQAGAFIKDEKSRNPEFSVEQYIKIHKLSKRTTADVNIYSDEALRTAVRLNCGKINKFANKILNYIAFMNPAYIRSDMFLGVFNQKEYYTAERQLKQFSVLTVEIHPEGRYLRIHRTYLRIHISEMNKSICDEMAPFAFKLIVSLGEFLLHHEYLLKHMTPQTIIEGYRQLFETSSLKLTKHLKIIGCNLNHIKDWGIWHYACYNQDYLFMNASDFQLQSEWSILHVAILNGRAINFDLIPKNICIFLKDKRYINSQISTGQTPLHISIMLEVDDNVDLLLDLGADVNIQDKKGQTPLHLAAQNSDENLMIKLILAGGKVNLRNNEGNIPLHIAAIHGDKYLVQILILSGGSLKAMNLEGYNPVYLSAYHKHPALTEFMLEYQTDYNVDENNYLSNVNLTYKTSFNKNKKTCTFPTNQIWLIINRPYKSRVIKQCVGLKVLTKVEDARTLLQHCLPGQTEYLLSVVYLLEKIPLALQMAAAYILHNKITIEQFSKYIHQAPPSIKHKRFMSYCSNQFGSSTIKLLCLVISKIKRNHPEAYEILCYASYMNPSNICLQRLCDYTKLAPDVIKEEIKILVTYLILNKINEDRYSMDKIIGILMHFDLELAGKQIKYCERILLVEFTEYFYPDLEFVLVFLDEDDICSVYKKVYGICDQEKLVLARLNKAGCRIKDTAEWSALHYAAADDILAARQVMISLLLRNSDPNVSCSGLAPLHVASASGNDWAVGILLLAGAEVNAMTNGQTALHLTARCEFDTADTVRALIKKNINTYVLDDNRHTPVQIAKQYKNFHLLDLIMGK